MQYDKEKDCFICPSGRQLIFKKDDIQITDRGYQSKVRIYESVSCEGCPLKEKCTKAKGNRIIQVRFQLEEYKKTSKG